MKIALWSVGFPPSIGGIESVVHHLVHVLIQAGHEVLVITDDRSLNHYQQDDQGPISVHRFPFSKTLMDRNLIDLKRWIVKAKTLLDSFEPALMHIHALVEYSAFYQCRVLESFNFPVVLTLHGLLEQGSYRSPECVRLLKRVNRITVVSEFLRSQMLVRQVDFKGQVDVIYNGIDEHWHIKGSAPSSDPFLLVMVARLTEEKGFDLAIWSLPRIALRYPDVQLVILGSGIQEGYLKNLVFALKLQDRVRFVGQSTPEEVRAWIDRASLVLIPSRYESFGLVAVEAAMRRRVVVASRVGGLPEVVKEGVTGFLVPPRDLDSLAQTIMQAFQDRPQLAHMGCEAEKWVLAQFTQKKMGEGYLKVYQEVVAGEPLVSVIIAVHNGAEHLAAAIESVLAQDYSNVEILVMNNGSTDNTETVARRYPQVRYHELPVANLNWARNQGVEKALGAILAFLDHDDTWPKDKLRRQVNYLKTHPEVAGVIGLQQMYLDEDCPKPHWLKADFLKEPQTAHLPSALMVRREAFETMGCFDERYAFASDVAWFFKANDLGIKIDLMPEVLLYRRIHRANVSHKLQSLHHEYLQIIRDSVQMKRSGASL